MKHLLLAIVLLAGLQIEAVAQHIKKMQPAPSHRKASRHRSARKHHRQTYYRSHARVQPAAASPYKRDNTPVNDGQRKNKQRNLNYNTGQALPASNGR